MRIIADYRSLPPQDRGATAAIGNFDGVHIGHRSVIDMARDACPDAPLGVLTFNPHPREYFAPHAPPFRLMSPHARQSRLRKIGVDLLFELPFDAALANMSPEDFACEVISRGLGLRHVVVGENFRFGHQRRGRAEDMVRFGAAMDFGVTVAPLLGDPERAVSSSAIRRALAEGRPRDAAEMLGHWHRIEGPVISGARRGRELGFPTANMSIDGLLPPAFGVYAVLVDVCDGPHKGSYLGAASIGVRPMFGENRPNLETFLLDFSGDLYGATLSVGLVEYLRPELKFDSLDALVSQMESDCAQARAVLART